MTDNKITIHFDGPIANDHSIQLRAFTKTLGHIQTAIDRAYLDIKYEKIWKYARLSEDDYPQTDFVMHQTREGGFIADLIGTDDGSKDIVTRVNNAVAPAYEQANSSVPIKPDSLIDQAVVRREHYRAGVQIPTQYEEFIDNPDPKQTRAYGDRSIVKEFDQIASAIRARQGDGSLIEIDLYAGKSLPKIVFDLNNAEAFHKIVSVRTLGDPIEIPLTLRSLDAGKNGGISKAKATNLVSTKDFNLFIPTDRGFSSLRKYLKKRNPPPFQIVACPVLEYGAFDPLAGDMYFLAVLPTE